MISSHFFEHSPHCFWRLCGLWIARESCFQPIREADKMKTRRTGRKEYNYSFTLSESKDRKERAFSLEESSRPKKAMGTKRIILITYSRRREAIRARIAGAGADHD